MPAEAAVHPEFMFKAREEKKPSWATPPSRHEDHKPSRASFYRRKPRTASTTDPVLPAAVILKNRPRAYADETDSRNELQGDILEPAATERAQRN